MIEQMRVLRGIPWAKEARVLSPTCCGLYPCYDSGISRGEEAEIVNT